MSRDDQGASTDPGRPTGSRGKPWFVANRSGVGYHPRTWQGWLILAVVVAAIIVVVVLVKSALS